MLWVDGMQAVGKEIVFFHWDCSCVWGTFWRCRLVLERSLEVKFPTIQYGGQLEKQR